MATQRPSWSPWPNIQAGKTTMGQQVVDEEVEDADDDPLWMFRIDPGLKLLYGSVGGKC